MLKPNATMKTMSARFLQMDQSKYFFLVSWESTSLSFTGQKVIPQTIITTWTAARMRNEVESPNLLNIHCNPGLNVNVPREPPKVTMPVAKDKRFEFLKCCATIKNEGK